MAKKRTALIEEPMGPENAAQRQDIERSFINIGDLSAASALPANVGDIRVLVGRKGSGKTHILRHIQLGSETAGRIVFYETLDEDFITDSSLMNFRGDLSSAASVNLWTNCWRFAMIAAAFSHFSCSRSNDRAQAALGNAGTSKEGLARDFGQFLFTSTYPIGPFDALKRFFARYKSLASVQAIFAQVDFREAELELGRLLHGFGDLHYLIDGIDEFAATDPRLWLEPQLGLFKLNFLQRVTRAGAKRVYITVALRAYVFSHALKDPQADRLRIGAGIVPLNWNAAAATAFMNRRLQQIARENFARAERLAGERPLARWLGFGEFTPHSRGRPETVEDYLIRHTRCSPRHVIQMFTQLCQHQNKLYLAGGQICPDEFETIIKEQSRAIAKNTLQTTAEELLSYVRLERDVTDRKLIRAARDWYGEEMGAVLQAAIQACGTEVVERATFRDLLGAALADVVSADDAADLIDIAEDTLWRSGIIGYRAREGGRAVWRYAWSTYEFGVGHLPPAADVIGLHPSFVTSCNLEVSPDGPVF